MTDPRSTWVTGAGGLLGRAVVSALAAAGHRVVPIVRARSDSARHDDPSIVWDLRAPIDRALLAAHAPDRIVHLAAARPTSFDAADVESVAATNLAIDRAVFALAAERGVPVVYASGCSVYGGQGPVALAEDALCAPLGPYPAEKLAAESIGLGGDARGGFRFTSLRISALYGPGQTARTVLRHFVGAALRGDDLTYHGTGSREQDFVHARDVAAAFVACCERDVRGVYNVAAGAPITMRELAEKVVSLVPGTASVARASGQPDPQEGLTARYAIDRARVDLGWSPSVSLDEGLRECIAELGVQP